MLKVIKSDELTDMSGLLKDDLRQFRNTGNYQDEATLGEDFALIIPLAKELHNNVSKAIIKANIDWVIAEHQPHMFKQSKEFKNYMDNAINDINDINDIP